ncbi:MAG: pilus assembly protein PilM [Dehalococcoidia bacterium]|nr:pilus assembly protein PilM [Dehalococcoidia bacterium]
MAKEVTTIYIDDSAIRVLRSKGRQVRKWADMPLESGLVKDGTVVDEDAVAAKIKELWQTQKIGSRKVIAGVNGINCLYRLITLPELPKNILPEAVEREARRILAIPLEQLHLSWQAILTLKKGEMLVYLAALPRNSTDGLISTLHKAGLNPYLMDLKPLALARTITETKAILIDVQPGNFDIVILMGEIPQVVRSLPLDREASLDGKMPLIKEELQRAITFYNSSHLEEPIEASVPVLISGELSGQPDSWELLLAKQKHPVQILPSPMESSEDFPASQYTTNIGLALKEVLASEKGAIAYSLVNFNALPEMYIPRPRPVSEILFAPVITIGIALLALGAFANITTLNRVTDSRHNLATVQQMALSSHAQIEHITALIEEASSTKTTADAFTATLNDIHVSRDEINGDLAQVNSCLSGAIKPPLSVSADGEVLTVDGLADDADAVLHYARELRATGRFASVLIASMSQQEQQIKFTLELSK